VRRSAEEAGRDPAAIELSVSGYLPATTDDEVDAAERAGAVRMVVATSVTPDLDALGEELSAFAVRFGITSEAPASASATTAD
jgi:hypothetical protein